MISAQYVNSFRIGGDPEFCLVDSKDNLIARRFNNDRRIGNDGGGRHIVELRPHPAFSVGKFISNIKTVLEHSDLNPVREYKWRAGAMVPFYAINDITNGDYDEPTRNVYSYAPIGGHIHIEVPYVTNPSMENDGMSSAVPHSMFNLRLEAWDLVTKVAENVGLLPKAESEQRRNNGNGYGRFGAYHKVGGPGSSEGPMRVEYRTPCSWLFSPKNAFVYITLLKIATVSPIAAQRAFAKVSNATDQYAALLKLLRNYQNVDHDAFIASKKILVNMQSYEKMQADPAADFKKAWDIKPSLLSEYDKKSKASAETPALVSVPAIPTVTPTAGWTANYR